MKKKALILFLSTMTVTALLFTGCRNKETETTPFIEETVEEIDTTELEELIEEIEATEPEEEILIGNAGQGSYENGTPDLVDGTALTQAELDALSKTAVTDEQKKIVNSYKEITENGSWTSENGVTYTKAVGKPDSSWRRMTDEEAKAIIAKGENSWEAAAAQAELEGNSWYSLEPTTNTIYFDYYVYQEEVAKPRYEQHIQKELEYTQQQLEEFLAKPDMYIETCERLGKIYLERWAVESLEIWETYPEELKEIIELY